MRVALLDYGAGNLQSVANALRFIGVEHTVIDQPGQISGHDQLVLPGVGAFGDCMAGLHRRGLVEPIREWIAAERSFLGMCVGFQVLFEDSEESPGVPGLGVIKGRVRRFSEAPGIKIPHMGWNSATPVRPHEAIWNGLGTDPYFYFVHSYFPVVADPQATGARTDYAGESFSSVVSQANLLACQFHPEKSQDAGLRLMRNFLLKGG